MLKSRWRKGSGIGERCRSRLTLACHFAAEFEFDKRSECRTLVGSTGTR